MLKIVEERRYLDRLNLNLKVFERETGERLGLTENIHCEGMMLITVKPFTTGKTLQVIIELPSGDGTKKLVLTAVSCWNVHDKENSIYNVGFRFLYPSPEMKSFYETLFHGLCE